jgi:antitoxin CcdA
MRMADSAARRKAPTNVSVRADLVRQAKLLKLNLSELLETALEKAIRDHERETWLASNRDAIDGYNAQVAKRGVFSDDWRRF